MSSVSLQAHASNPRQQGEETTGCGYSMMCCEHVHSKHELGDSFFPSPCCIMCGKCRYCFSLFREKCVSAGHSKIFDFPRANRQKWTFYDQTEKRTMEGGKGKINFRLLRNGGEWGRDIFWWWTIAQLLGLVGGDRGSKWCENFGGGGRIKKLSTHTHTQAFPRKEAHHLRRHLLFFSPSEEENMGKRTKYNIV